MTKLQQLEYDLRQTLPDVITARDQFTFGDKSCFLDISYRGRSLIVVWYKGRGFSLHPVPSTIFGELPDEVASRSSEALQKAINLLTRG